MQEALKVGVSGVRGIVGDSFTPQVAASFAQAFGVFVGAGPVIVGRDTRPSGRMIEQAVIAGLQSVGCKPVLAGVVPTPTMLVLTRALSARGGMVITASHNPAPWNALKFIGSNGLFLDEAQLEGFYDVYHQQEFPLVSETDLPIAEDLSNPVAAHFNRVLDYVDVPEIRKRRFKVAMDCCNGAGAVHSVGFLRDRLGCEVVPVFDTPSGAFERTPEPIPAHLGALSEVVKREHCDLGFAQDPDADRLALVDETGFCLVEDMTLALAVQEVLEAHEQGPVVMNINTSKRVEWVARKYGSEVVRTKIGEINVSGTMVRMGSVVGGEGNGGVIVPAIHPCRDSFSGMALLLSLLARTGRPLSELAADVPAYCMQRVKISVPAEDTPVVLRQLRRHFEQENLSMLDGVYVDFGDAWLHVRRSNTESVLRITAETLSNENTRQLIEQACTLAQENIQHA